MSLAMRNASYRRFRLYVQAIAAVCCVLVTPAAARTLKLVAFGDSLTAGYGLPPGQTFPEVLQRELRARGYDVEVVNAGVSGETAEDGLARFDWSVPAGTDAMILELGANDMLRGMPPAGAKAALSQMLAKAKAQKIETLLTGMRAASNLGPDYRKAFDAIYPDLAQTYGVALYPFFLDGVAADPKLNQPDGLHPNKAGVQKIVTEMLPSVEKLIGEVKR